MNSSAPNQRRGVCRVRLLFLFSIALLVTTATLHAQGSAVRVETFSLKPHGEVVIENPRGATRVESWDAQTVRVVAEKKAGAGTSMDVGELVLMGTQNSVIVQCKSGIGRVDLTMYVPHGSQLQITGGGFPVEIGGTFAEATVATTSGNIAYRLAPNDDARIAMRSTAGTVRSTMTLAAVDRGGTHSLRGQLGSGAAQVILNSQTGNISLTPGPTSSAIAKASLASAMRSDVARSSVTESVDTTTRTDGARQNDGGNAEQIQRAGSPAYSNRASQPPQTSGSVTFAGNGRSSDSNSTTRTGPFVRPRTQRDTSGGDAGLKVRIIPSNSPPRAGAAGSIYDQANDQGYVQQSGQSNAPGSSVPGGSGALDPNSSTNDSTVFAGSDRSSDGSNASRVGPLERDRQMRNTNGGNSGLRVRIIPAPAATTTSGNSSSVFDNRDNGTESQPRSAAETSADDVTSQHVPEFTRPRRSAVTSDSQEESGSISSSRTAPPELRRAGSDDASRDATRDDATPAANGRDEDAILLKAALVNLNVSVTNRAGVALGNLKKDDFAVAENGEPQKIEFFQSTAAPFNLVLALDLSGSIKEKLDLVKSAALRFLDVVGPQDKVAVVTFTDEIRVASQLTSDREELKRRIKAIDKPQGGTAFYEAMWFALLDTLRGTRGQRNAIVVMTDGVDSSLDRYNPMQTRVTFNQLGRRLEESDVIVFPIYLDTEYEEVFERGNSTSEAYAIARDQLDRLAELSGGLKFTAEKANDLSGVYKQVAAALRTVYSVGYYPTNPDKDGTFRRVRVVVDRPDAAVKTRKGYYAK
jgi:VWFA-related protein